MRNPPRNPANITIDLRTEIVLGERDDMDGSTGGTQHWHATARCGRGKNSLVGTFDFYVVDLDNLEDPTLDFSGSLQNLIAPIMDFKKRDLTEDFREKLEGTWLSKLLLCDRAEIAPAWRGHGLGPVLAGMIIEQLSEGCAAVLCEPDPILDDHDKFTKAETAAIRKKIIRAWKSIGFERLDDRIFYLDPLLQEPWKRLKKLKAEVIGN